MERHNKPGIDRRVILGLIAMLLGVLIMASNFGVLPYRVRSIIFSWEMLLIVIGTIQILSHREKPIGFILVAIGVFFILPEIFRFSHDFHKTFWPVMLIVAGLIIIFNSGNYKNKFRKRKSFEKSEYTGSVYVDELNIFGGSKRRIVNRNFKGGRITNIFGGTEIDLSESDLNEGKNILEVICIFGGMSLIVPSDWNVYVNVVSIFGEFKDKRILIKKSDTVKGDLTIKGMAIFGGGDIKSII
jgi:predicted membrane protein